MLFLFSLNSHSGHSSVLYCFYWGLFRVGGGGGGGTYVPSLNFKYRHFTFWGVAPVVVMSETARPCSCWCLIHLYVVCHHFIYNLGQNKMKQQTPHHCPPFPPPTPESRMKPHKMKKNMPFSHLWFLGERGSRVSIYFVQDCNLGQNKMEQQTPIPPNQGWSRTRGNNVLFSHL